MLDYLVNYGVKKHSVNYEDIDVNDRLALQDQINEVRRNYSNLLKLLDDVQGKYLDCKNRLSRKSKEIISDCKVQGIRANEVFATDDDYLSLEAEEQALKSGLQMINNQIEYCKSDLRILNSVFYNKF